MTATISIPFNKWKQYIILLRMIIYSSLLVDANDAFRFGLNNQDQYLPLTFIFYVSYRTLVVN